MAPEERARAAVRTGFTVNVVVPDRTVTGSAEASFTEAQ
jgi:hypothetical protein